MGGVAGLRGCALAFLLAYGRVVSASGQDGAAGVPDLAGRWAMVQVMPALTSLPVGGGVELTTIALALVDIEQVGTSLVLRDLYCSTDVRMSPGVAASRVPEAFVASLSPAPRAASLELRDGEWRLVQPLMVEVRGAVLGDPIYDPLPTDSADPRVWDQDGDGHPGLTVGVTVAGLVSGDTYVVQRLEFSLQGRVCDRDTVYGWMNWTSEQNVVAATSWLLRMSYEYRPHPDPARSVFVMRRIDPSCACTSVRDLLPELLRVAGI